MTESPTGKFDPDKETRRRAMGSRSVTMLGWGLASLCVTNACFDFEEPQLLDDRDAALPASGGDSGAGGRDATAGGTAGEHGGTAGNDVAGGSGGTPQAGTAGTGNGGTTQAGTAGTGSGGTAEAGAGGMGSGCDPTAPFVDVMPLESLNSSDREWGIALSADERFAVFSSNRANDTQDLFSATRADATAPFGSIGPVPMPSGGFNLVDPALSFDSLTLYFTGTVYIVWLLQVAKRSDASANFGEPSLLVAGGVSDGNADPFVAADNRTFCYSSNNTTGGDFNLFTAELSEAGTLGPATELPQNTLYEERAPVLSADQLTLYFASNRPPSVQPDDTDIWVAHRTSTEDEFGDPTLVEELNGTEADLPEVLSADGCSLYFVSDRSGNGDIYVARKAVAGP